ncbi:MAG: SDR family NAD(P)-dependent oxidoreductase [Candidatus Brocadiales bacterium]|nr:SDR family NAD(P)-dependent oxidoreductase [Candidatus Brocadiales bacterium]
MSKKNSLPKSVLITGATSGIGAETSELFLKKGFKVYGTSRKPDDNRNLFSQYERFSLLYLDLGNSASITSLPNKTGPVDILIHNAGISQIGAAEDISEEISLKIFKTNFFGIIELNKLYLPLMRNAGFGRILHISSLAAKIPLPYSSLYAASKAALDAYSYSLRAEVKIFNISVSSIYFDYVKTALPQIESLDKNSPYYQSVIHMKIKRDENIKNGRAANEIAQIVYQTSRRDRLPAQVCIGKKVKLLNNLKNLLPNSLTERIIQRKF